MYSSSGLGQTDTEFLGARDVLLRQINFLNAKLERFPNADAVVVAQVRSALDKAQQWFKKAIAQFYEEGNNRIAMESLVIGFRHAQTASALIGGLDPRSKSAAAAEARATRGASFSFQVKQTVSGSIAEPLARIVEIVSPAAAEAIRLRGWFLVPILGGGLLVYLLRR